MADMTRRRIVFWAVLALLVAFIGGFAFFQFSVKPQMIRQIMAAQPQPTLTVTAEPVRAENWEQALTAVGTLKAERGVDVATQVDGLVRTIPFSSGQDVPEGALLVQLDDSVEQADLKSAQADYRRYSADYERNRDLVQRGAVARAVFDTSLAARDTAAASIERIKAQIAKKAIYAPFAGKLGIRRVDVGQYLPAGTMIVTLQSLDPIFADFPIPEQDFQLVQVGEKVQSILDAYPGRVFPGRVQSIDPRVDPNSRTFLVRAVIENPDHNAVPGMFANVKVQTGIVRDVITVPRTAVTFSLYGENVLVVKDAEGGAQTLERRFVRAGDVRDERIEIVEGLKPGEVVVTSGQIKLDQGMRVRVDNTAALQPPAVRPRE
jgi:membrane fusion protein (multidrug efflux system)